VTALWLHLRASRLLWALPPLTALILAVLLLRPDYWVGVWPETGAAAQIPAIFLSTVAAGAAAWISTSRTRHRLAELTAASAIRAAAAEAYRLGAVVIVVVVPYLIGQAVAFVYTARTFPVGIHLWFGYAAMGIVVILFAAVWGWAFGRYLSAVYAPLVASLTWLVFQVFPADRAALSVISGPVWQQPNLSVLAVRLAAVAAFTAAVMWARPRRTQWSANRNAPLLPVAAGLVTVAATLSTSGVIDRAVPDRSLCVTGEIDVCLWPEHEKYVPMVRRVDARVASLPAGFQRPARLHEYGIERKQFSYRGQTVTQLEGIDISEGLQSNLGAGVANAVMTETLKPCDLDSIRQAKDITANAVGRWLELYLGQGSSAEYQAVGAPKEFAEAWSTALAAYTKLTPAQQREWAQQRLAQLATAYCE